MPELSAADRLRNAVASATIPVPGAFNALAARMIEAAGYPAMYLSGAALSAGVLGVPDVGLFTQSELVQQARYLVRSVKLPLIVDADTGFGDVMNVERTVVELEATGVAAIQIEDQSLPKRCGHLSGKSLIAPRDMAARLKAASRARGDRQLVLIARTDARGVEGLSEAIDRAKRYLDAGADWIFPEALASRDEFAEVGRKLDAPLVANMTEFGKSPLLSIDELADLGYAAVLYPVTLLRLAMKAAQQGLAEIAARRGQRQLLDSMLTRAELYDLLDYRDYEARDREYFDGEKPG